MKIISSQTMRAIDKAAIEGRGIPGLDLMESAGAGVTQKIVDLLGDARGRNVSIFCGKGNNGGDGFVIARRLSEDDVVVKVFLLADPETLTGDAAYNFEKIPAKVTIIRISKDDDLSEIAQQLPNENIIVDALLGTGIKGPVKDEFARVIEIINSSGAHVVSVDVPSGVEGSTGKIGNVAVKAAHTVTMAIPKLGLFLQPGNQYSGDVSIVDIGVPDDVLAEFELKYEILNGEIAKAILPSRNQVSHKGDYGRVLVIGGSRGMAGAVAMASESALRVGAGMVVAASPESVQRTLAVKMNEVMTLPLVENKSGTITLDAIKQLKERLDWADVVAIGPGIGVNDDVIEFMGIFLDISNHPLLIDADGIKCVTPFKDKLGKRDAPVAITPHPGELAFFLDKSNDEILENYFETVVKASEQYGITIHLKAHRSVCANPDGFATINATGNSGMATAGSGDVLTGIIAGLMSQGVEIYDSVRLGAYLHGLSGDMAASEIGEHSLIAGDLIDYLPSAIMRVLTGK
jgi:NAD(P)H-hydrate epimerase